MNIDKIKVRKVSDSNWVRVTPYMADHLLALNSSKNRRLSMATVRKYAEDMSEGRWGKLNSNPICVVLDKSGHIESILDGQHRLAAVIQSGVTIPFEFVELDENNFKYLDQGKNRRTTDFIQQPNVKALSALALRILKTKKYDLPLALIMSRGGSRHSITQQRLLDYMYECEAEFPDWQDCIKQAEKLRRGMFKKGVKSVYAYLCWLLKWLGEDDHLDAFISDIENELSESVAVRLFKNFFQQMLVKDVEFSECTFLTHLLWTYDHFDSCRYKYYPSTKVGSALNKYDDLIAKKKGVKNEV